MIDEMRAAEDLVRRLAPEGLEVPIPEPLAVDESHWFLVAVDKALVEFSSCTRGCDHRRAGQLARQDHFETDGSVAHHLFDDDGEGGVTLRRRYLPCIAAYARAVLDLGYDADEASLLRCRHTRRFPNVFASVASHSDAEFRDAEGAVQLQIISMGDRQSTRKLSRALDACLSLSALPAELADSVHSVLAVKPRHVWVVGPNAIDSDNHVFRVRVTEDDARFERIDSVPSAM